MGVMSSRLNQSAKSQMPRQTDFIFISKSQRTRSFFRKQSRTARLRPSIRGVGRMKLPFHRQATWREA